MRILLQKLYHSYDACLENVVLIRICYVLFSLSLFDELANIRKLLVNGCWRWCCSDDFIFPSSLVNEGLEVLSELLIWLREYI